MSGLVTSHAIVYIAGSGGMGGPNVVRATNSVFVEPEPGSGGAVEP